MTDYKIRLIVEGQDNGATGLLGKLSGGLGGIGMIAGGILSAGAIQAIGNQVMQLGQAGLDSYRYYERLGMSLAQLSAREALSTGTAKTMTEALASTGNRSKELLAWTEKLAIQSPFNQQGIADAFKMQMAYGFTSAEAQHLTQVMVDFSAGAGLGSDAMGRISLALGQIKAKGKLAGQEVMQLTESGIGVDQILSKAFGKSTAQIVKMREAGLIPANDAIKAIVGSLETDFAGAAIRQATSFDGLITSLDEIKSIGLREILGGAFKAAQPYLISFVDAFSKPEFRAGLQAVGKNLGEGVTSGLAGIQRLVGIFSDMPGLLKSIGMDQVFANMQDPFAKLVVSAGNFGSTLRDTLLPQLQGLGANMWGDMLDFGKIGLPAITTNLANALQGITDIWKTHGAAIMWFVKGAWDTIAATIGGTLILISGVISAGVTWIGGIMNAFSQLFTGNWTGAWSTIQITTLNTFGILLSAAGTFMDFVLNIFGTNLATFNANWAANWNMAKLIASTVWANITATITSFMGSITGFITGNLASIQATWTGNQNNMLLITSTVWAGIQSGIATAIGGVLLSVNVFDTEGERVIGLLASTWKIQTDAIVAMWKGVMQAINDALNAAKSALDWASTHTITYVVQTIGSFVSGGGGSSSSNGGSATPYNSNSTRRFNALGGSIMAGQTTWVGEKGPELFVPKSNGNIIPNSQAASLMKGKSVSFGQVNIYNASTTEQEVFGLIRKAELLYG